MLERVEAHPELIACRFEPIADLVRAVVAGYEVRLQIGGDEALAPPGWSGRVHVGSAGRLEAALVGVALAERERLPEDAFLLVGASATALRSTELPGALAAAGSLERLVVLVSADDEEEDPLAVRRALDAVRELGGTVAVDDAGSGYASLRQVLGLRPDLVRIGAEFVAEVDRDQAKAAVVETLTALASRIGARVIADGIAGRPELGALRRMGVGLGQGAVLGEPATTMEPLGPAVVDALGRASAAVAPAQTVAGLVEERPALRWGGSLEVIADAFLDDPRNDVVVLVDERDRPLALADRAALLRGEAFERPVMRITPTSPLKAVARRAAARPMLERYHPLVVCDPHGVYLGLVRVEQLLDALGQE